MAYDPWTHACYCPECWAAIVEPDEETDEETGGEKREPKA